MQSVDDSQPGSRGAAGSLKPLTLAAWNQPALSPHEEKLLADFQPKVGLPVALCREQSPNLMIWVSIF